MDFLELMHEAYSQNEISADEYMINVLSNIHPYDIIYKKFDEEEEDDE